MKRTDSRELGLTRRPPFRFAQTDLETHEKWAALAVAEPRACSIMHVLVSKVGRSNAVVISQKNLARLANCSRPTIQRALEVLKRRNWIEVRQIGSTGTTNAYIINDRVAWSGKREGIRYSLFSATVLISDDEQKDKDALGDLPPIERIPMLEAGEQQLPSGPGLPPPSEPQMPGLETDLPSRHADGGQTDLKDFIDD